MRPAAALQLPRNGAGTRARALDAARADYALPVPTDATRRAIALGWLGLALLAIIASGVFSVLLVAARTPFLAPLFPIADFFHVALVVHVDLS
ncbi:MAG TPA: hypothetical protein VFN70_16640, partial [Burkholderiales bacterium]|nr:hypothetical protein [Burkholderiales bacterium]